MTQYLSAELKSHSQSVALEFAGLCNYSGSCTVVGSRTCAAAYFLPAVAVYATVFNDPHGRCHRTRLHALRRAVFNIRSNTLNGDDDNETAEKKKVNSVQELGYQDLHEIRPLYQQGRAALLPRVAHQYLSVLSHTNIEIKIRHLMMVLSALPRH